MKRNVDLTTNRVFSDRFAELDDISLFLRRAVGIRFPWDSQMEDKIFFGRMVHAMVLGTKEDRRDEEWEEDIMDGSHCHRCGKRILPWSMSHFEYSELCERCSFDLSFPHLSRFGTSTMMMRPPVQQDIFSLW